MSMLYAVSLFRAHQNDYYSLTAPVFIIDRPETVGSAKLT